MTSFAATCEKCGGDQALTAEEQTLRIGPRGQFVCDDCGGAPVEPAPMPEPEPEPTCACMPEEGSLPAYFRRCPDCPIQS